MTRNLRPHEVYGYKPKPKPKPTIAAAAPTTAPKDLKVASVSRSLLSGRVLHVHLNREMSDMELASIAAHFTNWSPSADDPQHLAALICTRCKRPHGRHDVETMACPNGSGVFSA